MRCAFDQRRPISEDDRAALRTLRGAQYAARLDDDEADFLDQLTLSGTYTPAQRDWLDRIWDRVMG